MGAIVDLTSATYWDDSTPDLRLNPALGEVPPGLPEFIAGECGLRNHVVFQTSGSGGSPKYVCLSKVALLAGAEGARMYLDLRREDVWLCALPTFHVGGFAISARAFVTGAEVVEMKGAWDALSFVELAKGSGATWVSLVPTQLYDLVLLGESAPRSLRGILIGGAALGGELAEKARKLGWPVLPTFGMTEAGSQIATAQLGGNELNLLPGWKGRVGDDERLSICGDALFSGYVEEGDGGWRFRDPRDADGWFETTDRVRLDGRRLTPLGRLGDVIKVLGELVDMGRLRRDFARFIPVDKAVLVVRPDERTGSRIVAVFVDTVQPELVAQFNAQVAPFERITATETVATIPKSALGKVKYGELV